MEICNKLAKREKELEAKLIELGALTHMDDEDESDGEYNDEWSDGSDSDTRRRE